MKFKELRETKDYENFRLYMERLTLVGGDDIDDIIASFFEFQNGKRFDPDNMADD